MFCRNCGNPLIFANQKYCSGCGAPVEPPKKRSPFLEYVLAILRAAGWFAVFFLASNLVTGIYSGVVSGIYAAKYGSPFDSNGYEGLSDGFWSLYSENFCWIMSFGYVVVILLYFLIFKIKKKSLINEVRFHKIRFSELPASYFFGLGLEVAVAMLISIAATVIPGVLESTEGTDEIYNAMFMSSSALSQFIFSVVATAVMEELVFRGLIYNTLKKSMPQLAASLICALAFGLAHSGGVQFVYTALLSLLMVVLYEKYNSLWICIFLHAGFNSISVLISVVDTENMFVSLAMMACGIGLALIGTAYFFASEPVYKEIPAKEN